MSRRVILTLVLYSILLPASTAQAHAVDTQRAVWTQWHLPTALGLLVLVGWYAVGVRRVWHNAGQGRGVRGRQVAAFSLALLAIFAALGSPLDALSDDLFWTHMVQHLLLIVVAAPLLVRSQPAAALVWALPSAWRRWTGRMLQLHWAQSFPLVVWLLAVGTLWLWHAPLFYQAAIHNPALHVLEHTSLFATALLFWWVVGRGEAGRAVAMLFGVVLTNSLLGALLTFSPIPWYPHYTETTAAYGVTPLEDQQLAGVMMWLPPGLVYLGAAATRLYVLLAGRQPAG